MTRQCGQVIVIAVIVLVLALGGGLVQAQGGGVPSSCVLVLPLQAGRAAPTEAVAVGWAVHNMLENMLVLHSGVEECWSTWFLRQVFPQQQELQAWIQGQRDVPTAVIEALGVRYLVIGQVQQQRQTFQVSLTLRDRTSDRTWAAVLDVDLPGLVALRQGFLTLLADAGIPAPAAQQPKMLWVEELPLAAFLLLGHGLETYVSALHYDQEPVVYNPTPFAEGVQLAPRSYLLLNNLAWVLLKQNKDAEAKARFDQALALHPSGVDAAEGLIRYSINTGEATMAEAWAARKAQMQGQTVQIALADLHASWALRLKNRYAYQEAIAHYQAAFALDQRYRRREAGIDLINLGEAYRALSQYAQAISSYEQARTIQREVGDRAGEGRTLTDLGEAYQAQSQYAQAIDCYQQALELQRAVGDQAGAGTTLNNLGGVYDALSQYAQAIDCYQQALELQRAVGDQAGAGTTLNNLGGVYDALSQYARAISYYEQALVMRREAGDRAGEGATLNNLGEVYRALQQYARAISYYEQALAIAREVGNRAGEGTTLNNLGAVYQAQRQYTQASATYQQALAIAREVGNRAGEAATLHNLMVVWQAQQHPRLAILYGKRAVNTLQSIRGSLQTLDKALQQGYLTAKEDTYRTLATLLITANRLPEAQQVLAMLKEEEYFEFTRRDSGNASTLTVRATLTAEETALETAYTALADQITLLGKQRGDLLRKPARTDEEEQQLNRLEEQLAVATDHFTTFLEQLQVKLGTSSAQGARVAEVRSALSQSTLRELGEGVVLLVTVVSEGRYYVMLITPDSEQAYEHPITAVDLAHKVLAFRELLQDPRSDPVPLARELYDILVGPKLAHDLQQAGAKTLMWSLDGVLRYLPIAALRDARQHYLVETYRNVLVTLASLTSLTKPVAAHWQGLGLGVSKGQHVVLSDTNRRTLNPLPGVRQELYSIIRDSALDQAVAGDGVLVGRVILDENFTKSALRAALRQQYALVHIASHFVFQPGNETNSFLLLGDPDEQNNKLTIAELNRVSFEGVALLTLSACETAMSGRKANGVEVESFGELAQRKGAAAVMATLWPVADMSTPLLMREFYRLREAHPGMMKAEALRRAQVALLTEEIKPASAGKATRDLLLPSAPTKAAFVPASFAHPFYWAPFILIGNWK
jgi:CHAT domain-containing protein/tetratricopeptide (TPR) repeat protein